jgi:outer membrane protein OmpA-like peptidoglycan-associated protein
VKPSTALIFGLFSTSLAHAASANEVIFTCNYELGTETDARRKIGSAVIAIDVNAKTARIDFGKGWFKTMTLRVDGTDLKETAPPTSGEELGYFHFDLTHNSGGFSGESGPREFFDPCVQNNSGEVVVAAPRDNAQSPTLNSDRKKQAIEAPAATSEEPTPPPTGGHGITEYYGGAETRPKSAWTAEATMNPDYKKEETRPAAAPVAANELVPPATGGHGTTEYYGGAESRPKSAWPAEATMNPEYDKGTLAAAGSSTAAPAATPVPKAIPPCRDAISDEAPTAKVHFANSSIVIEPDSQAELRKIAKIAKKCESVMVEVAGHTDNLGNPASNKELSQLRANAVVDFLIREGFGPPSLKAVGYGQEQPIATNATLEGRRLNRRVEIRVLGP